MGLSFVSKVAPSRFQGLMQGGWLLATAVGNKLLVVGTILWDKVALSTLWMVLLSAALSQLHSYSQFLKDWIKSVMAENLSWLCHGMMSLAWLRSSNHRQVNDIRMIMCNALTY